jgi:hypothetical protein
MGLRAANATVSIWRKSGSTETEYAEPLDSYVAVAGLSSVAMDIQLAAGSVEQRQYGRVPTGTYQAFAASGLSIKQDDGVLVETSTVPALAGARYLVKAAMDWGARGGLQLDLEATEEDLGDG